ncbi:hypothetical protein SDC9_136310 [bioreactor metagenome]|uniref:Uncharacterized protein n=1 Tax=bioreactor metagenome TaxID=1076179 RepID=A0A645DKX3_9ZZZZ
MDAAHVVAHAANGRCAGGGDIHRQCELLRRNVACHAFGLHRVLVLAFALHRQRNAPVAAAVSHHAGQFGRALENGDRGTCRSLARERGRGVVGGTAVGDRAGDRTNVVQHLLHHQFQIFRIDGEAQGIAGLAHIACGVSQRHGDVVLAIFQAGCWRERPLAVAVDGSGADHLAIVGNLYHRAWLASALELRQGVVGRLARDDGACLVADIVDSHWHLRLSGCAGVHQHRILPCGEAFLASDVCCCSEQVVRAVGERRDLQAPLTAFTHQNLANEHRLAAFDSVEHLDRGASLCRARQRRSGVVRSDTLLDVANDLADVVFHVLNSRRLRLWALEGEVHGRSDRSRVARDVSRSRLEGVRSLAQSHFGLERP